MIFYAPHELSNHVSASSSYFSVTPLCSTPGVIQVEFVFEGKVERLSEGNGAIVQSVENPVVATPRPQNAVVKLESKRP